ncbi:MAG: hypothetical protein ACLU8W_09900 [Clostridia bacterium]
MNNQPVPENKKKIVTYICIAIACIAVFLIVIILFSSGDEKDEYELTTGNNTVMAEKAGSDQVTSSTEFIQTDNFELKISSMKTTKTLTNSLGAEYSAKSGYDYLMIVFDAKNISKETQNIMNVGFNGYVDDTKTVIQSVVGEIDGYMPLIGAVSSGKSFEGYSVWEVPENWEKFEFSYIDARTGEESNEFTVYSQDVV